MTCKFCQSVGRSGEDESQEDVLMDEAPSNISQASTLQANREGKATAHLNTSCQPCKIARRLLHFFRKRPCVSLFYQTL